MLGQDDARCIRPEGRMRVETRPARSCRLVLETKGQQDEQTAAKHRALEKWVAAVNQKGGFGKWSAAMSTSPGEIKGILSRLN